MVVKYIHSRFSIRFIIKRDTIVKKNAGEQLND